MAPADGAALRVEVAYSPAARTVDVVTLNLPAGSTVGDAVATSGLLDRHGLSLEGAQAPVSIAVWGRTVSAATPLRDRDRVELLRPLLVDPKEARRLRYRNQGERRVKPRR
jgi:hypothetical protein